MRRGILLVLLSGALLMFVGATLFVRARLARCAAVPVLAASRVGAPDFTQLAEDPRSGPGVPPLPIGWSAWAKGVQVGGFTVSGTGNSFQLLGIANALVAPPITVRPGERFCVTALALADARALMQPEKLAELLVRGQQPPTHLSVETEDLESYFLRTIRMAGGARA